MEGVREGVGGWGSEHNYVVAAVVFLVFFFLVFLLFV